MESPTGTAPDCYIYYPGSEELGKDEIRRIALGAEMPAAGRSQAATCWPTPIQSKPRPPSSRPAPLGGGFNAESLAALAAAVTAVCERVIALAVALHGIVVLTALGHAGPVSLRAGIEAGISLANLC